MTKRRPHRIDGFDYLGSHRYFVTCCAFDRHQAFTDGQVVENIRHIVRTCEECGFEDIASICMPDHFHGLFEGQTDDAAFVPFMKLLRQRTACAYNSLRNRRLWQDGYYEHVMRDEETTPSVVAYIIGNPVRARLVEDPAEYPYLWCKYGLGMVDIVLMRERPAWAQRRN